MNALSACAPAYQERASDPISDGCEPPCGSRELNWTSGSAATEPSHQSPIVFYKYHLSEYKQMCLNDVSE